MDLSLLPEKVTLSAILAFHRSIILFQIRIKKDRQDPAQVASPIEPVK